jgi:hypothetical protein
MSPTPSDPPARSFEPNQGFAGSMTGLAVRAIDFHDLEAKCVSTPSITAHALSPSVAVDPSISAHRHSLWRLRALVARRRGRCYVRCEAATGPSENTLGWWPLRSGSTISATATVK